MARADTGSRLDVREIDGEPFQDILTALDDLPEGETLTLVNSFEPEPLYDVLERRGFEYRTSQVDTEVWEVEITHA